MAQAGAPNILLQGWPLFPLKPHGNKKAKNKMSVPHHKLFFGWFWHREGKKWIQYLLLVLLGNTQYCWGARWLHSGACFQIKTRYISNITELVPMRPLGDVLMFRIWFAEPSPWNQFHPHCLQTQSADGNQPFLPHTQVFSPEQTVDLFQTRAKRAAIMWAVQTVGKLSSHLNFQSHPLKRLQAKPKPAVTFLPRVKEINRLQYRLTHGDIPSVLGCMVPKLNRGNKQASVASLRAVCNTPLTCQIALADWNSSPSDSSLPPSYSSWGRQN